MAAGAGRRPGCSTVDGADPATARFALADGTYDVFVDETSPAYLGGLADVLAATGSVLPQLVDAYRTGAACPTPPTGRTRSPDSRR